jgi:hypothetical protein
MKQYVIILSDKFPTTHPRKGQKTRFGLSLLNGKKIHTIRGNFHLWEKRLREVQEGRAVLSIRKWTGVPYRSPQEEIRRLTAEDGVGIQKATIGRSEWKDDNGLSHFCYWARVNGKEIDLEKAARNDGFIRFVDFVEWFDPELGKQIPDKDGFLEVELAIIHFTNFRY